MRKTSHNSYRSQCKIALDDFTVGQGLELFWRSLNKIKAIAKYLLNDWAWRSSSTSRLKLEIKNRMIPVNKLPSQPMNLNPFVQKAPLGYLLAWTASSSVPTHTFVPLTIITSTSIEASTTLIVRVGQAIYWTTTRIRALIYFDKQSKPWVHHADAVSNNYRLLGHGCYGYAKTCTYFGFTRSRNLIPDIGWSWLYLSNYCSYENKYGIPEPWTTPTT